MKYLVIGGVACGIYGSPRATVDLDIAVEASIENIRRLYKALEEAGFGTVHLTTPEEILANEINIFEDYVKLDVITKPKGLDFKKSWARRVTKNIGGIRVKLVSLDDLIDSKSSSKRFIDKEDARTLKKIKRRI